MGEFYTSAGHMTCVWTMMVAADRTAAVIGRFGGVVCAGGNVEFCGDFEATG